MLLDMSVPEACLPDFCRGASTLGVCGLGVLPGLLSSVLCVRIFRSSIAPISASSSEGLKAVETSPYLDDEEALRGRPFSSPRLLEGKLLSSTLSLMCLPPGLTSPTLSTLLGRVKLFFRADLGCSFSGSEAPSEVFAECLGLPLRGGSDLGACGKSPASTDLASPAEDGFPPASKKLPRCPSIWLGSETRGASSWASFVVFFLIPFPPFFFFSDCCHICSSRFMRSIGLDSHTSASLFSMSSSLSCSPSASTPNPSSPSSSSSSSSSSSLSSFSSESKR
mmetsp:Transcript_2974/g.8376  ORF Transcript_2974/g.8376 Transcript_2974/m.8376 type:complete len:280 (-) Transcript_2974:2762-3601(-)